MTTIFSILKYILEIFFATGSISIISLQAYE